MFGSCGKEKCALCHRYFTSASGAVRYFVEKQVKVKVKVKLSLCFNLASRHEGVLGSGGIAPLIF
jgi:hypothetical protein